VPLLLGVDTIEVKDENHRSFNSALFVDRDGSLGARYDKMHPVLFGEYIPFGKQFPWLYRLTPLGGGLTAGERPRYGLADGAVIAPNICYETVVPHVICRQVRELAAAGHEPDVLVNVTNDGWYLGSSELDLHLMCGVFRAVECRKPLLIAANTGFSASIDSNGRILEQGPRRATGVIVASTLLDDRDSPYLVWGDYPAGICLALCAVLAVQGMRRRNDEFRKPNDEGMSNA
jgi:apolipoprotein N-acyltransferase